ncbi:hypothetical protein KJ742_03595 [Patescibacteria group bacterium]|nr:hypothetical protein [Patescibacteria group bacterium]MBU1683005.1 hypothetical protein [Patescibacteria group bacterium]
MKIPKIFLLLTSIILLLTIFGFSNQIFAAQNCSQYAPGQNCGVGNYVVSDGCVDSDLGDLWNNTCTFSGIPGGDGLGVTCTSNSKNDAFNNPSSCQCSTGYAYNASRDDCTNCASGYIAIGDVTVDGECVQLQKVYQDEAEDWYGELGEQINVAVEGEGDVIDMSGASEGDVLTAVYNIVTEEYEPIWQSPIGGDGVDMDGASLFEYILVANDDDMDESFELSWEGAITGRVVGYSMGSWDGDFNYWPGGFNGYEIANNVCSSVLSAWPPGHPGQGAPVVNDAHVCTPQEIINTYVNHDWFIENSDGIVWVNTGSPAYITDEVNDCNGWTTDDSDIFGNVWVFDTVDGGHGAVTPCNQSFKFACCK